MRLYSTRPNVNLGNSSSLAKGYFLNRVVIINNTSNTTLNNSIWITVKNSKSLMTNGFLYRPPFFFLSYSDKII